MVGIDALHFDDLVVARAVVERVGALGEVVHDIVGAKARYPRAVMPGRAQRICGPHNIT